MELNPDIIDGVKGRRKIFGILFFGLIFCFFGTEKIHAAIPAIYDNPGQGVFQCHDNGNISQDYLKGGGVIVRWDQLQPVDNDHLDQTALTALANKIKNGGKKVYLHFQIYAILQGTANKDVLPNWLYPQVTTITINNSRHPVPWDLVYQQKLGRFLELLAAGLAEKEAMPNVEYIEPAAGGMWGSTHLWIASKSLCQFAIAAGCSGVSESVCNSMPDNPNDSVCGTYAGSWQCLGNKFNQGVNAVFEKYLTAFPNLAIIRAGGNCLCGDACNYKGMSYMSDKFGLRFMIKGAGIGDPSQLNCGMSENLNAACKVGGTMTKCGQEPYLRSQYCASPGDNYGFGGSCGYKNSFNNSLNNEKISYYCLYSEDIGCNQVEPASHETINNINRWVAEHVGAQIFITNKSLDGLRKNVGGSLTVSVTWQNQGSAPLAAPLKQGIKWIPSSYKLFVEFVKNGSVVNYQESALSVPTQQWATLPNSTPVSTTTSFNIPSVLGGAASNSENIYRVYIGLTDPNGERKRFALRNSGSENDLTNRRYLLTDSFTVVGSGTPPETFCSCPSGKMAKSVGNADCNDAIDGVDFGIWREEFLGLRQIAEADFDCNNQVNGVDFEIWRRSRNAPVLNLTATCNSATQVTLSWNAVANKKEYWVGMCDHTADPNCTSQFSFRNASESVTKTVIANHWYGWWLTAFDNGGNVLARATAGNWFKCPQ